MAFLDFFWKKIKYFTDTSAQNIVYGMNEHFTEIYERLRRIETKQKENTIQLEEIDDFLQSGGSETVLIETLMALTDTIGDFYFFAAADTGSPLFEQAHMMWSKAKNAAEAAELKVINAANEPFDFRFHSTESAEEDIAIPNGYIIKTLKFGYIYKNEVIRRAAVVINKIGRTEMGEETEETEPPNIIYL